MRIRDIWEQYFHNNKPLTESIDRNKVLAWIKHNPALRVNQVGGEHQHETFSTFGIAVTVQQGNNPPQVIGYKDALSSDELQKAINDFKNLGVDDELPDADPDDAEDFMKDAAFYALCSAKEGPTVWGVAIYSMDDPRWQQPEDEDDELPPDEDLFGLSKDEMDNISKKLWGNWCSIILASSRRSSKIFV